MLNFDYFFSNFFFYEFGVSILMLNVIVYVFLLFCLFLFFFLFDLVKFKSLNDFKRFGFLPYVTFSVVIILLSLAGMPPLMGFLSKFFIFLLLLLKNQFLFFFFFSIISLFSIYFYFQNIRFVITKNLVNFYIIKNYYFFLDFKIILLTVFFNFLNIFGIFFLEDFLIFLNFWSSFIKII